MEQKEFERPSKLMIEEFKRLPTTNISDALDRLGIKGGCEGIVPIVGGLKLAGSAFTVKYVPVGVKAGTVGDYVDYAKAGDVVVIDNAGRTNCTVWGDLLTMAAVEKKLAGTVIDGVCRDIPAIKEIRYPMFSRGAFMMTGKDRVKLQYINMAIAVSGVAVDPGDIVVADDSGVVVVPLGVAREVLEGAKEISEREKQIEEEIRKGATLAEARKRHGYHQLQRARRE